MSPQEGLYPMGEEMPCAPLDVIVSCGPDGTLGLGEAEELAGRLISFSQDAGMWVGVSADRIQTMLDQEAATLTVYCHDDRKERPSLLAMSVASGTHHFARAVGFLLDRGLVRLVGRNGDEVIFPTRALVDQRRRAA